MSFVESVAAALVFTYRSDTMPDASWELVAQGVANLGGGLTSAMPAGSGTSQTAVNDQSGARSQLAEITSLRWITIGNLPRLNGSVIDYVMKDVSKT